MKIKPGPSKFDLALAIAFIVFGVVNLVHPFELTVFQATCEKPMFSSCRIPPQPVGPFGVRVTAALSVLLGAGLAWLVLFWPRKQARLLPVESIVATANRSGCQNLNLRQAGWEAMVSLTRAAKW